MFSPLEVKPVDRDTFDARLSVDRFGPVIVAKTACSAAAIEHTDHHLKQAGDRRAFLFMPIHGRLQFSHYGHEVELEEGDFALDDSFAPSRAAFAEPNHALGVSLPYETLCPGSAALAKLQEDYR